MADKGIKRRYNNEGGTMCMFLDTQDPYVLRDEAQEARDLLASNYVNGAEFVMDGEQMPFYRVMEAKEAGERIRVCSIGAVYYVQGHHAHECNLIKALDRKAHDIKATWHCECGEDCDPPTDGKRYHTECEDGYWENDTIVDVNDTMGLSDALEVFDAVIADFDAQIKQAEDMAADYPWPEQQQVVVKFQFNTNYPVLNYGTPTPIPASEKTQKVAQ